MLDFIKPLLLIQWNLQRLQVLEQWSFTATAGKSVKVAYIIVKVVGLKMYVIIYGTPQL